MILFEICRNCGGPVSPAKQAIGVCNECVSASKREPLIQRGPRYGFQVAVNRLNNEVSINQDYNDSELDG